MIFFFFVHKPACSLWTWHRQPLVWRRFWEAQGWSTCSPSGSCPGSWCGGRARHQCSMPAEDKSQVRKDHITRETCASPAALTRRLQVVLHNVPVGLHHLKHHVVLDVLHKVQHALSEGKRSGKPAHQQVEECENAHRFFRLTLVNSTQTHHLGERKEYCLKSLLLVQTLHSSRSTCLQ